MSKKKRSLKSKEGRKRWSMERKMEVVLRLLRGESLDGVSWETGVSAAQLSEWRDTFIATGKAGLKSRTKDPVVEAAEDERRRLLAKVGEFAMENEILKEANKILEGRSGPFALKRSKR
jgi:transposase-like protein